MKKKDLSQKALKSSNLKIKQKTVKEKVVKEKVVKEKKVKSKPHYVDPQVFSDLIVKSYKNSIITDDLADSVLKIATRLSYAPNFINYSYRDEMVGDAIVKMLYAIKNQKFDPEVGNAFSYFTRIAFNAFCNRIKKEKKEKEFILNLQDNVYDDMIGAGFTELKAQKNSEDGNYYSDD
jgi:hypothetical protein